MDFTVAMNRLFLDDAGRQRTGLGAQEKQQGLVLHLLSAQRKLQLPSNADSTGKECNMAIAAAVSPRPLVSLSHFIVSTQRAAPPLALQAMPGLHMHSLESHKYQAVQPYLPCRCWRSAMKKTTACSCFAS